MWSVAVEPQYAFLEAQWAVACAQADSRIQGIVAACPVEFGLRAHAYIEALVDLDSRIKGVRRNIQDEKDPQLLSGSQILFAVCNSSPTIPFRLIFAFVTINCPP